MFTIKFDKVEAAVEDEAELVPRILRDLADRIAAKGHLSYYTLYDLNGNRVGSADE